MLSAGTKESCQAFFIIIFGMLINYIIIVQYMPSKELLINNRTRTNIEKQSIQSVLVDPWKDLPHHLKHLSNHFFFQCILVGYAKS